MPRTLLETARRFLPTLRRLAPAATLDDAHELVKCELTLHRWAEQECGDSDDYSSWCITRDETSGVPYFEQHAHAPFSRPVRYAIPDREKGALRRVAAVCARLGLHYYQQTDPRGVSLYVADVPIDDVTYSAVGRAVHADR